MDIAKPNISEAKCAESVKMAMDLAKMPPVICKITNKKDTRTAIVSLRIASLLDSVRAAFLPAKLIGVLAGKGVP